MFSLVHFSRVFPFVHPGFLPIDSVKALDAASACASSVQGRRLKSAYRRHLRGRNNDALTYSGASRPAAG